MDIADAIAPLLSITQWVMLIALIIALASVSIEAQVGPKIRRFVRAYKASRNATAHPAPSLSSAPVLRASPKAAWKLADPHPGLQAYKKKKAQGLH